MMLRREDRYVRFQDWRSEQSVSSENIVVPHRNDVSVFSSLKERTARVFAFLGNLLHSETPNRSMLDERKSATRTLHPQGPFLQKWNKIFVISCIFAVSVDPLFLYIPVINDGKPCWYLDRNLEITASVLRFFTDIFYILHIIFQFRTGFITSSPTAFGRGVLIENRYAITKRYLSTYFFIDVFAVLPLPQVVILVVLPKLQVMEVMKAKNVLMLMIICQYVPRLIRIRPLYLQITRSAGVITETAGAGAAFNLVLYMLASHVLGAVWYLLSIQRQDSCWREQCRNNRGCNPAYLYCGVDDKDGQNAFLSTFCQLSNPPNNLPDPFFGIYAPAIKNISQSRSFFVKLFFCVWWGLQNLSSLGQNLKTSTYAWENLFAVFVSISGLVLFALLIGNVQTYLQSASLRIEEMRVKSRDTDQWMSYRLLPENLKERIRRYEQYRWQETSGVDEEHLLMNLPKDLRMDIKRHLCLSLLMRVPMFENMDDQLLNAMCDRLKPVLYTEGSCVVREGDPVNEMLFLMRGNLMSMTTNGGRTGFFNSDVLKGGDFCGEELLTWALDPTSTSSLPSSTRTVKTMSEVEAFALRAEDLKFVATQFRRLHSKKLQHTFRLYSPQWRTWAACFIQAAWHRYCRKKIEDSLREKEKRLKEKRLQFAIANDGPTSLSFLAAIYASRFSGNMIRILRRNATRKARLQERVPARLLQKPAEPNFSAEQQ
ncbi:cyclic nucleotide-gated ion channel 1-like [Phragmites australis]|uniref:cyclic nucleotide-gated ion channel 1-like n=1 Tax=Phragmites australis TaxID=29695 RepID=UPI002D78E44F|nr:cyclic nucleotide-gated ion channel 1-like [Phragmites australis]XP_062179025.1 cyclic nucleotide-gated ion channel 1-like [Phragmites australis]XP_062179026.1 cyclic nucleotide-gated ion channel 1-like [Phragmites australis]